MSTEINVHSGHSVTPGVGADTFRTIMASWPASVCVVTVLGPGMQPWGMTCSSLCSVTITPPTVLVCLRAKGPTAVAVRDAGKFAANLLHHHAWPIADLFASGAQDRFDRVSWQAETADAGPHLPEHSHAVLDCRISGWIPVGDHAVVLGEVYAAEQPTSGLPLLYGFRRYTSWQTLSRLPQGGITPLAARSLSTRARGLRITCRTRLEHGTESS